MTVRKPVFMGILEKPGRMLELVKKDLPVLEYDGR